MYLILSIGLALFVLMLGVWQASRLRVYVSGDHAVKSVNQGLFTELKHWGKRILALLVLVVIAVFIEAWLWTQNTYEMAGSKYQTTDITSQQSFPLDYTLKKPLWELGFAPLPTLVSIKPGSFNMGSNKGSAREQPVHTVNIPAAFSMSQHEITFEQYDYFIWQMRQANIQQVIDGKASEYRYPYDEGWGRGKRPAIYVSWREAQAFANWLSKKQGQACRLPSEAEWEYAARGGSITEYPWGDEIGKNNAKCSGCGSEWDGKQTAPVGRFKPNEFGLYDMHGNVREWVQDTWHDNYTDSPDNGDAWESNDDSRVLRGGAWSNPPDNLRSANRNNNTPDNRNNNIGVRIVCSSHSSGYC